MSIKEKTIEEVMNQFRSLKTANEKSDFIKGIATVLLQIGEETTQKIDIYSVEVKSERNALLKNQLKKSVDMLSEALSLLNYIEKANEVDELTKKCAEYEEIKTELIEQLHEMEEEKETEIEKAKKATKNKLKKDLQYGRDRIFEIVSATTTLGEKINSNGSPVEMLDSLNSIRKDVKDLVDEMQNNELWGEDESKPETSVILLKEKEEKAKPKSKTKKKVDSNQVAAADATETTAGKSEAVEKANETAIEVEVETIEDATKTNIKVDNSQVSFDVVEEEGQMSVFEERAEENGDEN